MALSYSYIDRILYDSYGHTGNTYYFRLVHQGDGKIWDAIAEALATTPTWEDSAISLTETGTTGQFPINIPSDVTSGLYDVIVYKQDGSAPANTDDVELQYESKIGSIFKF